MKTSVKFEAIRHNRRGRQKNWWHRYFWSQHEYWAKFAVYKAAQKARSAKCSGQAGYFFWSSISLRAAAFCERIYGPVPELLVRRPIQRQTFSLSSPEVSRWLRDEPPYRLRKRVSEAAKQVAL